MITTVMLFAAGLGSRMAELTSERPKPLINILGKPIIHYSLELLLSYPFKKIVLNTHYLHQQIAESIEGFIKSHPNMPEVQIIYEPELLETGGGLKNAISELGNDPIFTLNTDVILKSDVNIFNHLQSKWDPSKMDFLLLAKEFDEAFGYRGYGDFEMDEDGKLSRPEVEGNYSYMYAGLQILKPTLIARNPLTIFSLREYYLNNKNLYGTSIEGLRWYHATTPEDIVDIEFDLMSN